MDFLIAITLFVGLLVWILYDMRQIRKRPLEFQNKTKGWSNARAELKQARIFILGLSGAIYVLAVVEWMQPSASPFTGRLSSLTTALYYSFGPKAIPIFYALIASAFALLAMFRKNGVKK